MLLDLSLKWTDVCHEFANWVGGLVLQQQQKLLYFAIFRVKNEMFKVHIDFLSSGTRPPILLLCQVRGDMER